MKRLHLHLSVALLFSFASIAFGQTITTVAGGGPNLLPAKQSNLNVPPAVAQDHNGNTYVAAGFRVFKIDSNNTLTVFAGNGFSGFNGDGGQATAARLGNPVGLALDSNNNLYIADLGNAVVRRVDANTKVIRTVVGIPGNQGGGPGDPANHGDGGPPLAATLSGVVSLTFDGSDNLYIADDFNGVIRKVDRNFTVINTYAGYYGSLSSASDPTLGDNRLATNTNMGNPNGVVSDAAGNIYIADQFNNVIRRVDVNTHKAKIIAGQVVFSPIDPTIPVGGYSGDGGAATAARLNGPWGITLDSDNDIFVADSFNNVVRHVDSASKIITTVNTGSFTLANPLGVVAENGPKILIADTDNLRVLRNNLSSNNTTLFAGNGTASYSGDGYQANRGSLTPEGIAVDLLGNLYVADTVNNIVRRVDAFSKVMTTVAGTPATGGDADATPATNGLLSGPASVAVDLIGNLYIADELNSKVRRVDAFTHAMTTVAGAGGELSFPQGLAVDLSGNVYIADTFNCVVRKLDRNHNLTVYAGSEFTCDYFGDNGPATSSGLFFPVGLGTDLLGNLYIADSANNVIRRVDARTQTITTVAGSFGSLFYSGDSGPATSVAVGLPGGVDLDLLGNLYFTDTFNNVIWRVDGRTQQISRVAGDPNSTADIGDGGPATAAALSSPLGVAVDLMGTLYIGDTNNSRVRQVR